MANNAQFVFTLEYVADIEGAKRFFENVIGLEVERAAPTFVQFKDQNDIRFAISSDEPIGSEARQELYWSVDDAEVALRKMAKSAEVCVPLKELPFGKVFGIQDPTGQPQYILELSANRPSQPA